MTPGQADVFAGDPDAAAEHFAGRSAHASGNITIGGADLGTKDPWEAITKLRAERDSLTGRIAGLLSDVNRLTAERDKLITSGNRLMGIIEMYVRSIYAVRIDVLRDDRKAVLEAMSEALDGFDGPEWNGSETGLQWLERARAGLEG